METLQLKIGRLLKRGPRPRLIPPVLPVEAPPLAAPEESVPAPPDAVEAPAPEAVEPPDPHLEAIRLGYRLFLDREVEEVHLEPLGRAYPTVESLRNYLLNLPEFRQHVASKRRPPLKGNEPPMQVDRVRTEADTLALFRHVQETWQGLGETEPHWSVATSKKFLQENFEKHSDEFFASGEWDMRRFRRSLARNGIDPTSLRSCLELGCGVGRVTAWLARTFDSVVGYDISTAHLDVARLHLETQGIGNVELRHLAKLEDLRSVPKVDAVFTVVVLQHNPPPIIGMMIEELIRALNPGGVAFFQVPTYRVGYRFDLDSYLANEATAHEAMEMHVLPQGDVFEIIERCGARAVEVLEDSYTLCPDGEVSSTFVVRKR